MRNLQSSNSNYSQSEEEPIKDNHDNLKKIKLDIGQQKPQNTKQIDDICNANIQIKINYPINNQESASTDADSLNFDQGDSEQKQFSKYYTPLKIIGSGAFGKVVQARKIKSNKEYAVKIIAKNNVSNEEINKLRKEAKILSSLDHKNIVKFEGVLESETRIFIIMELLQGGTLKELMGEKKKSKQWFTEQESALIMNNLMSGVAYFHTKSIVHRDLKPENILIGDKNDLNSIKIADFGLSTEFEVKKSISFTQQCGTLIYMAPEFFNQKTYSKPIDIWSCAIILYQLLCQGAHPLYNHKVDDNKSFRKTMQSSPQIKFPSSFPEMIKNLIQKMTLQDPSIRYTANQVLLHPWITQNLEDDIPLTMNEMLQSVNKKTDVSNIQKAMYFLCFMKAKMNNNTQIISESYKEKCKLFSQTKKRNSRTNQKDSIFSQNYLSSDINLERVKEITSSNSDNQNGSKQTNSEDNNSQKNSEEQDELAHSVQDNLSSAQVGQSPLQRCSLTSTKINLENKCDQNSLKYCSPIIKKQQVRKNLSVSEQKKIENNNQLNGSGIIIPPFKQNDGFNQDQRAKAILPFQILQQNKNTKSRSISLNKTNHNQSTNQKSNDKIFKTPKNTLDQDQSNNQATDFVIENLSIKYDRLSKRNNYEAKEQEANSSRLNRKQINREEFNNQMNRNERQKTLNQIEQRSLTPNKKTSQFISIQRDSSRRGNQRNEIQESQLSQVKLTNSASPKKKKRSLNRIQYNSSINDETLEQHPHLANQAYSALFNIINSQQSYVKQAGVLALSMLYESPKQLRKTSQIKNSNVIKDNLKLIQLQKEQMTVKLNKAHNSSQIAYPNQNQTIQQQISSIMNNNFKAVGDFTQKTTINSSPTHFNYSGQIPVHQEIAGSQLSNTQRNLSTLQPPKDSLPSIRQGNPYMVSKGQNQSTIIRERWNRAISQDQRANNRGLSSLEQNLNKSMIIQENSNRQQSLNATGVQSSQINSALNDKTIRLNIIKEIDMLSQKQRNISNLNVNKIAISQRLIIKK